MSQQPDNRVPDHDSEDHNQPIPRPRNWRAWLVDVVGSGVAFGVMFLIDRLRPGRRGRYHVEQQDEGFTIEGLDLSEREQQREAAIEEAPRVEVVESTGGGHYETAAGLYEAPPGVHEAPHSVWPALIAASVALAFFGLVTVYAFSLFALVVFIVGVGGWVSELIDE